MAQLRIEGGKGGGEISLPRGGEAVYLVAGGAPGSLEAVAQRPKSYLAALLQAGGHWFVLAPPGGDGLTVDGVEVPSLKILDDQSVLAVRGLELRLAERVEEVLATGAPLVLQGKICPWCQRPFAAGDSVIYCPTSTCRLAHHADCLRRGKRCGSYPFCGYILPQEGTEKGIARS